MEAFFEWEEQLLMFLQNSVRGPVLDTIMQFITSLGDGGFLAIAACLVLLLVPRWRKVGLTASLSLALDYVFQALSGRAFSDGCDGRRGHRLPDGRDSVEACLEKEIKKFGEMQKSIVKDVSV